MTIDHSSFKNFSNKKSFKFVDSNVYSLNSSFEVLNSSYFTFEIEKSNIQFNQNEFKKNGNLISIKYSNFETINDKIANVETPISSFHSNISLINTSISFSKNSYLEASSLEILTSLFSNNKGNYGGSLEFHSCNATIKDSSFINC